MFKRFQTQMYKNTRLFDDINHKCAKTQHFLTILNTHGHFVNLGILSNPEIKKKRPFPSRILTFKNENAKNKKKRGVCIFPLFFGLGFFPTPPWPPIASRGLSRCPGVPVSRSVSRCPCVQKPPKPRGLPLPPVASRCLPRNVKKHKVF